MDNTKLAIGDSVVVKADITDPDTDKNIGGWQGRISEISKAEPPLILIKWDSITLKNMLPAHIAWCEKEGLEWTVMNLDFEDVDLGVARDTEDDVAKAIKEITFKSNWLHFGGEQGRRVQEIVNQAKGDNELEVLQTWHEHLKKHLIFPFTATVIEAERGKLREGTRVKVLKIASLDKMYGTLVSAKYRDGVYGLSLCDLEAEDTNSEELQQLIEDYVAWFTNH